MLCQDIGTMERFSERLKAAAAYARVAYSQTAIANSLGVPKQTVDRWFAGGEPRPSMIFLIAERWGVDPRWLADGTGSMIAVPRNDRLSKSEQEIIRSHRAGDMKTLLKLIAAKAVLGLVLLLQPFDNNGFARDYNSAFFSNSLNTIHIVRFMMWIKKIAHQLCASAHAIFLQRADVALPP